MYEQALAIIREEGFPPTRENLPTLCHRDLRKLSRETGIQVSKLAFYFSEVWGR